MPAVLQPLSCMPRTQHRSCMHDMKKKKGHLAGQQCTAAWEASCAGMHPGSEDIQTRTQSWQETAQELSLCLSQSNHDGRTEGQTDRRTDGRTDGRTDRQAGRQTDKSYINKRASEQPVLCTTLTPSLWFCRLGNTAAKKEGGRASSTMALPRNSASRCPASGLSSCRSCMYCQVDLRCRHGEGRE